MVPILALRQTLLIYVVQQPAKVDRVSTPCETTFGHSEFCIIPL